jgi:hypothetical protein
MAGQRRDTEERTGTYGGDDGALEHEREEVQPGEDSGMTGTPAAGDARGGETQAERKQEQDLKSGEGNPG